MGERIRHLRQRRGLGQAELARAVRRLPQDVYKWEHGRQVPSDEIPSIAEALGVTICDLYGVEEGHHVRPKEGAEARPDNLLIISDRDKREVGRIDAERLNGWATLLTAVLQQQLGTTRGADVGIDLSAFGPGAPLIAEAKGQQSVLDRPAAEFELGQSVESEEFRPSRADRATRRVLEEWASMTEEQRKEWLAAGDQIRAQPRGA